MNRLLIFGIFLIGITCCCSSAVDSEPWRIPYPVEGFWRTVDEFSGIQKNRVKLWLQRDTLYGKIVEILDKKDSSQVCDKCSGKLKDQPLEGLQFLWGFVEKNGQYVRGRVVDFQNGKAYKGEVSLSEDKDTLFVFSYVNVMIKVGRTQKWIREK